LTQGRATSAELESLIDGDDGNTSQNTFIYDDLVPFNIHLMKLSYYKMVDGAMQDFGDGQQIAFEIFDQFITGSRFQVHLVLFCCFFLAQSMF
jgi:hypothetical protein